MSEFARAVATACILLATPAAAVLARAQAPPADAAITQAVRAEFGSDPAVPMQGVRVQTSKGVVTLTGTVPDLLARDWAQRLAATVGDVRAVVNRIDVRPPRQYSDEEIRQQIQSVLTEDPALTEYEIHVERVEDGDVLLVGSVGSWQEKAIATQDVKGVAGVTRVDDRLEVHWRRARPPAATADTIRRALRWDALVDARDVRVAVPSPGVVHLSGSVGSLAEKRRARETAYIEGVREVDASGLKVVPRAHPRGTRVQQPSPAQVERAVRAALQRDPRVGDADIELRYTEGVLRLRGTVPNLRAKWAAEQDALNVRGVRQVFNQLTVRPSQARSDAEVGRDLRTRLARLPFLSPGQIDVDVRLGTAYLQGEVAEGFQKRRLDAVAALVPGVTAVVDQVRVRGQRRPLAYRPYLDENYGPEYAWQTRAQARTQTQPGGEEKGPDDAAIRREILQQLTWSPYVSVNEIRVSVKDGVATLSGSVDTAVQRRVAVENAYEGGARRVVDKLAVPDFPPGD